MKKTTIIQPKLPSARTSEIVVQDFGDEVLVYNLSDDKAHHLNKTLSLVWQHCDGKTTIGEISKLLTKQLDTKIEDDFIWLALDELNKANLFEEEINKSEFTKMSRRKVLFRYALPAASLPVVMSLVSPATIHAQSCLGLNRPCDDPGDPPCCPGLVCQRTPGGSQCVPTS